MKELINNLNHYQVNMKSIFFLLAVMLCFINSKATNYYFSSSLGNDQLNNGITPESPWQSITKLNTVMNLLQAGDSVFFRCNDKFNGQIVVSKSGNSSKDIYFGSYGSGKKPVISGTCTVSKWEKTDNNLWESAPLKTDNKITNFFINSIPQQIGRWPNISDPNKGYLIFESHNGSDKITDSELSNTIDWTGAEAVVRSVRWILDRLIIKSHLNNSLLFSTKSDYEFTDRNGYFIQNHPKTLDQPGEWYYNPINKKISLFLTSNPNSLITEVNQTDTIFKIVKQNYIKIENLHFYGSGKLAIAISKANYVTIRNNDISFSGENGVYAGNSNHVIFENNLINHTNNNALQQIGCNDFVMRNNVIKNTALVEGMGLGGDEQYLAVQLDGKNILAEYNTIDSAGYLGINFGGDSIIIRNNVISNYCMVKDDGGALYTWSSGTINISRQLIGNVVYNAIGAPEGTHGGVSAEGIYIDDRSANVDIKDNTVFNCGNNGIFIHNANHINVEKNTVYNNNSQLSLVYDEVAPLFPVTDCSITDNFFISKESEQNVIRISLINNGMNKLGNFDFNHYCRPVDDNLIIKAEYKNVTKFNEVHSLESWRSQYKQDKNSVKSPVFFSEYLISKIKSSNLIENSTFNNNTSGWSCWSNHSDCDISLADNEGVEGNAMKAVFLPALGKVDNYMIIFSKNFSLTQGKKYLIKFSAKANKPNVVINAILKKNADPWNHVASEKSFLINPNYTVYQAVFIPTVTEPNSRFEFELTGDKAEIWIDNVEITEVEAQKSNPDDYIRFEYNASKEAKIIELPEGYKDINGIHVNGKIILQPFSSNIFFKN